jgi:imidazoleglycerol-phosphate dehydratase
MAGKKRNASLKRKTTETDISCSLVVDGTGKSSVKTGIGMLDHMLELFAFWGFFDLEVTTNRGDLNVDIHHTNEDIGIVTGEAFKRALGDKKGIARIGEACCPMEKTVACVSLDICGRGFLSLECFSDHGTALCTPQKKEAYEMEYAKHFFDSFAKHLGVNLNITIHFASPDLHATLEPVFKALGIALDRATQRDARRKGIPSTKGVID